MTHTQLMSAGGTLLMPWAASWNYSKRANSMLEKLFGRVDRKIVKFQAATPHCCTFYAVPSCKHNPHGNPPLPLGTEINPCKFLLFRVALQTCEQHAGYSSSTPCT